MGCIDEPLYWLRVNLDSVSFKFSDTQTLTNLKIVKRNLNNFLNVSDALDNNILKILFNRIDTVVSFFDIEEAFRLLLLYYNNVNKKIHFNKIEKDEIENYLLLHKLNIIIQSNKIRFSVLGYKNFSFFLKSISLINFKQFQMLVKKFVNII